MTYGPQRDGNGLRHTESSPGPGIPGRGTRTQKDRPPVAMRRSGLVERFGFSLLGLSGGFVTGNLTGTGLSFLRGVGIWDGFSLILSLVTLEGLNYLGARTHVPCDPRYDHRTVRTVRFCRDVMTHRKGKSRRAAGPLTTFKLGLLFGTFTDAFKVGS